MASCITNQWVSTAPQIKLTVIASTGASNKSTLSWTLEYIASSAASTSTAKNYTVTIAGSTVKTGTYNINGKTGTSTIATGSLSVDRAQSAKSVNFACSMDIALIWSGAYRSNISASGSVSVPAITSYTINYSANGGSGAPAKQTKWYGTNITLSSVKPTKTGYNFSKWNTNSGGTGTNYNSGATYSANANATLYAQYTSKTYTVTFNANGGSGGPTSQTKTHGTTLKLSTSKPTRANYAFKGWATTSTSKRVAYAPGASYTNNSTITLYAVWESTYAPPSITEATVSRCNSSGTLTEAGTYIKVSFKWTTSVANPSITVKWKSESESTYASANTVTATGSGTTATYTSAALGSGGINTDYTYTVALSVNDGTKTTTNTYTVSSSRPTINALEGGRGIAFGTMATVENLFDVNFDARFRHDVTVNGDITAASGKFTTLKDAKNMPIRNGLTAYESAGIDPDTTLEHEIVTNAKTPNGAFMYILTYFYADKTATSNRMQIAMPYNKMDCPFYRYYLNGSWSGWFKFGGINHRTSAGDIWTGDVWQSSYPIMRRIIYADVTSTGTNVTLDTIENFGELINISGSLSKAENNTHCPPFYYYSGSNYVQTWVTGEGEVRIRSSHTGTGYIIIDYVSYQLKLSDLTSYI